MNKLLGQIDRWGMVLLIYLIPWQARLIFSQGFLAGVPAEPPTRSLFAIDLLIVAMALVRLSAIALEKDKIVRNRLCAIKTLSRLLFSFGALVTLAFFSVIVAGEPATALGAAGQLLAGAVVFFLVITAPYEREARLAYLVAALVQAAMAVMQVFFQRIYPSTWLGMAAHFPEISGTSVVESATSRFLRAYGTLPHPNILGGLIVIAILSSRPIFKRFTLLSAGVYLLLSAGLFFSFSRLAWLALLVGLFSQWAWARHDKVFLKIALTMVAALAALALVFSPYVLARVGVEGRLEAKSVDMRISTFKDAAALIKAHPLSGVGAGNFTAAIYTEIDPQRNGYALEPAHSVFLDVFAELGIFGLLLMVWLVAQLFVMAWKSGKIGLAAALVVLALFDHWGWTTHAGILIFFAGWALAFRSWNDNGVIQKAGAIIISKNDPKKILLLFRTGPNYDDWTIPKGHMEPGESREDTAMREVKEETGLDIKLLAPLPDRDYTTGNGHAAIVHFFLARSLDDAKLRLEPGFPGNKLEWVPIDKAERVLSFDNMKIYFRSVKERIK